MPKIVAIRKIEGTEIDPKLATAIFEKIQRFASYGFNKSHAAAYSVISFQTAYLKRHFPHEFFAASMNLEIGDVEDLAGFVQEARESGIRILPPDVNRSETRFRIERQNGEKAIRYALAGLRRAGIPAMEALVAERNANGPFKSFQELVRRTHGALNKKAYESLVKGGACDCLHKNRAEMLAGIDQAIKEATASKETKQVSMFDSLLDMPSERPLPKQNEMPPLERLAAEFDTLGFYFSGHPLDSMRATLRRASARTIRELMNPNMTFGRGDVKLGAMVNKLQIKMTKKREPMGVLLLSDPTGLVEALAFGESFESIRGRLKEQEAFLFTVSVKEPTRDGEERRLFVRSAEPMPLIGKEAA